MLACADTDGVSEADAEAAEVAEGVGESDAETGRFVGDGDGVTGGKPTGSRQQLGPEQPWHAHGPLPCFLQ